MIVRKTTVEEGRRVNELFAIAFEQPLTNGPANPGNDRIHHWAAFSDEGAMMSTLSISDYQIHFDGNSCKMGGIGGVATLPQYRRTGGIRGCFEAALPDMYAAGYDFSYLYPFSTSYYRKFGYECCVQKYHATINLGLLNPPAMKGTFRLAESGNAMADAIRKIDTAWENTFNMMVQHRIEDYVWIQEADPALKQEFTYVYFSADDTPKAYTTFKKMDQPDGRNLICSRFCFVDKEGFNGLMHLFKSLSSDHMFVKFTLPAMPSMQYLMPEWSMGAVQWSVQTAGMVRVINVENALKNAKYIGSGFIVLKILDDQIKENNHTYAVSFSDGRAVSVTQSQADPDAILSIPTFSALMAGVCDFSDASQWFGGLDLRNKNTCFQQIFYRKPLMIADYF